MVHADASIRACHQCTRRESGGWLGAYAGIQGAQSDPFFRVVGQTRVPVAALLQKTHTHKTAGPSLQWRPHRCEGLAPVAALTPRALVASITAIVCACGEVA